MSAKMTAPQIDNYIDWLGHIHYREVSCRFSYDKKAYRLIDQIFEVVRKIAPTRNNDVRELWLTAERGPIEDFGDIDELLADGTVESREEFEAWWHERYPEETCWYQFSAVEDADIGYRAIFIGQKFVIEVDERKEKDYPNDISEFAQWILDALNAAYKKLQDGSYNDFVDANLPPQHRTGTLVRKYLWDAFPDARTSFFKNISPADVAEFVKCASEQDSDRRRLTNHLKEMTANDFFSFCALGYKENNYEGCELSPREQYYKHADGRDDGLGEIDGDSPEAFHEWYNDRNHHGGHPWEVCRGGNSTHVSLYVHEDEDGYTLTVAGDAWTRTIESVKFYLALRRAGLPVYMMEATALADRLTEKEKIGIVPEGVMPAYCHSYFQNEHIIDFMNLPDENREKLLPHCVWQKEPVVSLL